MAPKTYSSYDSSTLLTLNGSLISQAHTFLAYVAFLGALITGLFLHYHKIVENEHFGYPVEWFPSVSATIGDRYPERSVFMVGIALTSGPRFILVGLWYLITSGRYGGAKVRTTGKSGKGSGSSLPYMLFWVGVFRTFTCGGWTYVTSTDDHGWHDIFMISYLVATLPWTLGCLALTPEGNKRAIYWRKVFGGAFFATLVPLVYFFIQHKVHKVPGAYTIYAFFEWALVLLDVAFDGVTMWDFGGLEIVVRDVGGVSAGNGRHLKDEIKEKERNQPLVQASTFDGPYNWFDLSVAAADIYNGFLFWTILTSLGVLVWYFPLWHMGISGYEVAVMSTISPFLLAIPQIRSLAIKYNRYLHFSAIIPGLLAWQVHDQANKLFSVSFAVWQGCLAWTATFYAERGNSGRLQARILAWTVGLVLSSIAKFACYSNNPLWPIMRAENGGWNWTGLLLAIPAVWHSTRPITTSGGDHAVQNVRKGSSLMAGVGIGGLVFAFHSLLSDSSTMISWTWTGFPVSGPQQVPYGALTILAMAAGLLLGVAQPDLLGTWTAYGIGAVGAMFLTYYDNWTGYYGGLLFTVYLCGVSPTLIKSAVQHNPALTFGFGFLIYNLMVLFHVWVVAYAFVPGGPLVREHNDWVMIATVIQIGNGVFSALTTSSHQRKESVKSPRGRKQTAYYLHILFALQLLSISVAYLRFPTNNYVGYHAPQKSFTAGIWTIHFSLDNDMWSSERRMASAIRDLEIDVIGLLESDTQRIIMGNRDTMQYLAEDLGMYVDYGPGPNKHTWGSALLSKFPILNSTHHLLPSPVGELAPAIEATLDIYGEQIDVFVFHSGQEEDPEDRRLQSEYLARIMNASPRPSILLSYLIVKPGEGNYHTYVGEKSGMHDIDQSDWDRWCEYVLYKGIKRTGYARVSRGTITDTEIQLGKFTIGQQADYSDTRIDESQIDPALRFPAMFRGEGVRGHRYHVFDEPRYFA